MTSLKRDAASGLIVVAPLVISFFALLILFRAIVGLPLVATIEPGFLRVPLVIVVFVTVVLAVGYLMRTSVGIAIAELISWVANRIPLLRVVFNGSRIAVETVLAQSDTVVEPVRIDSWRGLQVTAFSTGHHTSDGRLICFLPTAPNITTGYVIEVEEEDVRRTGEGVEGALTRILSAGFGDGDRESAAFFGEEGPVRIRGIRSSRRKRPG